MVVPCGGGASLYVGRLGRVGGAGDGCPMWGWGFSVWGRLGRVGGDGDGLPCGGGASLCADWGGWEVTVMVVPCGGGASLYVGRLGRVGGDGDGLSHVGVGLLCMWADWGGWEVPPMWGWGFSVCGQTGEGGR